MELFVALIVFAGIAVYIVKSDSSLSGKDDMSVGGIHRPLNGIQGSSLAKYASFRCGRYTGTLKRQMARRADSELFIVTVFRVSVPNVGSYRMNVEMPRLGWSEQKIESEDSVFLSSLIWKVPEAELSDAFRKRENVIRLKRLFAIGPGMIRCKEGEFAVFNMSGIDRDAQLDAFWENARALFWSYAQVAQMNIPAWRAPENNYDWWKDGEL